MKVAIPKQFQLVNRKYVVRFATSEELASKAWKSVNGLFLSDAAELIIRPGLSKEMTEATFFHELTHCKLEAIGRDVLSDNEVLVDQLGNVDHQFLQSKKGRLL